MPPKDDQPPQRAQRAPDSYGEAAMLLAESLLHALVARSALTVSEGAEIVQTAMAAQIAICTDRGDAPESVSRSTRMLSEIWHSFVIDAERGSLPESPSD